ncbi:hypothetical protein [Herbiconiux daphne]|uniref:Uncharacterized protein n=1 Tax=Herbiconiux daphne TaxID=2970914 RepID=A0ABT2H910_9MICO|nr:hypothetical protein [Herbiconiux daphne]MCS5736428.1 hypothetical protein [Herbiconiux daphne]
MAAIAAKDPIKVIDSLFDNYQKTHYGANEDTHYLAVKEFTVALSRYIYSTYSIGKGQNNFNEVYLP